MLIVFLVFATYLLYWTVDTGVKEDQIEFTVYFLLEAAVSE